MTRIMFARTKREENIFSNFVFCEGREMRDWKGAAKTIETILLRFTGED